jgi:hypothetical protein
MTRSISGDVLFCGRPSLGVGPSGPIVGALVVARADGTGAETKSITDSERGFAAAGLPAGTYTITAAKGGLTTKVFDHLD